MKRRDLLGFAPAAAVGSFPSFALQAQSRSAAPSSYDVRYYGAVGTGKQNDSGAVNAAIEAASAAGGGIVFFPAGIYLCFSIRLKSNIQLYLSAGAIIQAAASPLPGQTTGELGGVYDAAEPKAAYDAFQDYGHNHWHNSLIWGEGLSNIAICGPGLIFGKGLSFGGWVKNERRGDYPLFDAEQAGVGNKAIALKDCHNVIFRDFSVLKGGWFALLLTGVDNVTIDNLTIDTDRDGIDIDCCKNVHVSNCTVNSPWDDAICPKSSFALGYARATENLTISNCTVSGSYELGSVLDGTYKLFPPEQKLFRMGRIKCGTESNGGFKNIAINNCIFDSCSSLCLETEDGALCEDITISNITMRNLLYGPLFFRLGARLRGPREMTKIGKLRRILVSNIVSSNSSSIMSCILSGLPDQPIEDVKISDVYLQHKGGGTAEQAERIPAEKPADYPDPWMFGPTPSQGFFLRHMRNLEMSHVEVAPLAADSRPSFVLSDVERADFLAITAPTALPAFDLRRVKDFRIQFSRAAENGSFAAETSRSL